MGSSDGSTRERGRAVEQLVAEHLARHGLEILERNFEAAGAEVDLIGRELDDGEPVVVFVEIRSRADDERGSPLETISPAKQRKVIRAATAWLVAHDCWEKVAVRFDAVGVLIGGGDGAPRIEQLEWIRGAFEATPR